MSSAASKFILFVEGHSEQALPHFLKKWLDHELDRSVGIKAVNMGGWANFYADVAQKARMYLDGPNSESIIACIGLPDLYGPTFYPRGLSDPEERHHWGVEHLERKVGHSRFKMFFAVYELEAWILSQPELLPPQIRNALPSRAANPESINFNQPPSQLLKKLYQGKLKKGYKKVSYARSFFHQLSPQTVASKCPHFKSMLETMKAIAIGEGR